MIFSTIQFLISALACDLVIFIFFLHFRSYLGKRCSRRFWRRTFRNSQKWVVDSRTPKDCILWNDTPQRQAQQQRKRKTRRRFMSGLYESFCYTANHTIDLQPSDLEEVKPSSICSEGTHTLDPCSFHSVTSDFADPQPILYLSSSPYQPYGNSLHTCSSGFYTRTYSWSSRTSARTTTNSSGYCSGNNSCPSSANSHRSSSPTPDFSNIKLLSSTLEKCSLDEESILEESGISSSETEGEFLCTWPPFAGTAIKEHSSAEEDGDVPGQSANTIFRGKRFPKGSCLRYEMDFLKVSLIN